MKKIYIVIISSITLLLGIIFIYNATYSISDKNINNYINKFVNKSENQKFNISVRQSCNIGNIKFILLEIDNTLSFAQFKKGINNKYAFVAITKGFNGELIKYEIIQWKKEKYLLIMGQNPNLSFNHIKVKISTNEYSIKVPRELFFISYCELPNWTSLIDIPKYIKIFNNSNIDITDKYLKYNFKE